MAEILGHLWLFLLAVLAQYVVLAAGCALTVVIALIETYLLKRKISFKANVGLLCLFLFIALFRAWDKEYSAAHPPPLVASIESTGTGNFEPTGEGVVFAWVEVANPHSPPTALTQWNLRISIDSVIHTGGKVTFSEQGEPFTSENGQAMHLRFADECGLSTETPIPTGGIKGCWLGAVFPGLTKSSLQTEHSITLVSFKNVATGETTEITAPTVSGEHTYIPGIQK